METYPNLHSETNDPRREVVDQLLTMRDRERKEFVMRSRMGQEYIEVLGGLSTLFSYIKMLESQKVLDIGAGTSEGVYHLSRWKDAQGLQFEATSLIHDDKVKKFLGAENIHITSAEKSSGIPSNSYGGVLGAYSLSYSAYPELAMYQVDRILVPGGVLKTNLLRPKYNHPQMTHHSDEFEQVLRHLGYDIAKQHLVTNFDILLAIKPGDYGVPAQTLLDLDIADWEDQRENFKMARKPRTNKDTRPSAL